VLSLSWKVLPYPERTGERDPVPSLFQPQVPDGVEEAGSNHEDQCERVHAQSVSGEGAGVKWRTAGGTAFRASIVLVLAIDLPWVLRRRFEDDDEDENEDD
jgi:hypothetical protein